MRRVPLSADLVITLLAVAIVVLPLATGSFAARDSAFTSLAMQAVAEDPTGRTCALAWPQPWPLTQSDWVLAEGLLARPLLAVGLPLFRAHDAVVALGFLLTAVAGTMLSRRITGPGVHNAIGGVLAGLAPIAIAHGQHVNLVHHEVGVLAVILWLDATERQSVPRAVIAGAVAAMSVQFGVYLWIHSVLLLVCLLPLGSRRLIAAASVGLILGFLPALPVTWMYLTVARDNAVTIPSQELRDSSWHLADTLRPLPALLHRPIAAIWPIREPKGSLYWMNPMNPGYLATGLAIYGASSVPSRLRWALLATAAVAASLALGPELVVLNPAGTGIPGPWALMRALPGGNALREPGRWWMVAVIALSPLAAAGARRLGGRPTLVAAICAAVMVLELPPLRLSPLGAVTPELVYNALSRAPPGPLYDEVLRHDATCGGKAGTAILAAGVHRRPLVGSHYARRTAYLDDINRRAGSWPSPEALALFREIGVRVTLEHPPIRGDVPSGVECQIIEDHRLCSIP